MVRKLLEKLGSALRASTRGQSLLEFALVTPVFLWITVGIVDLGAGITSYNLLANAAREGARAGIYPATTDADIIAGVNSQTLILGTIPASRITITPAAPASRVSGSTITVALSHTYVPFTPLLSIAVGTGIPMTSTSTMMIE